MDTLLYSFYFNVKQLCLPATDPRVGLELDSNPWGSQLNSNAYTSALRQMVVGLGGFEPPTSRLSGVRSNQTEL